MVAPSRAAGTIEPGTALDNFFVYDWRYYFEDEMSTLKELLARNNLHEYSTVPKLYYVLRSVRKQDLISVLIDKGITDSSLPLKEPELEAVTPTTALSPTFVSSFLEYQQRIVRQELSVYSSCLDEYFLPSRDLKEQPLDDLDFQQIGRLLKLCGHDEAVESPKLYFVLRSIDKLNCLPRFLALQMNDIWFPFQDFTLTKALIDTAAARRAFLAKQELVYSTRWSEDTHLNFRDDDHSGLRSYGKLGSGGSGDVDDVFCPSFFKHYARKLLLRNRDGLMLRSFNNEVKVLKALRHRHFVHIMCSYTDREFLAILTQPVAGMDLARLLDSPIISPDYKSILQNSFGCMSVALAYLHNQGIKHKDIKPENILIHVNTVLFTDFGLSTDAQSNTTITGYKTTRYSPPEVEDNNPRTPASDIWSLGCVFFEVVAALKGFPRPQVKQYFRQNGAKRENFHANIDATYSWLVQADIKEAFLPALMLSVDQDQRPQANVLVNMLSGSRLTGADTDRCCGDELQAVPSAYSATMSYLSSLQSDDPGCIFVKLDPGQPADTNSWQQMLRPASWDTTDSNSHTKTHGDTTSMMHPEIIEPSEMTADHAQEQERLYPRTSTGDLTSGMVPDIVSRVTGSPSKLLKSRSSSTGRSESHQYEDYAIDAVDRRPRRESDAVIKPEVISHQPYIGGRRVSPASSLSAASRREQEATASSMLSKTAIIEQTTALRWPPEPPERNNPSGWMMNKPAERRTDMEKLKGISETPEAVAAEIRRVLSKTRYSPLNLHLHEAFPPASSPSLVFTPAGDSPDGQRSLSFPTEQRTLAYNNTVVLLQRFSEYPFESQSEYDVPPIGFKTKVVSRHHCALYCADDQWFVKDIGSSGGTFLNGTRLSKPNEESGPHPLVDQDILQLGFNWEKGVLPECRRVRILIQCDPKGKRSSGAAAFAAVSSSPP